MPPASHRRTKFRVRNYKILRGYVLRSLSHRGQKLGIWFRPKSLFSPHNAVFEATFLKSFLEYCS
jgi:hypothetical protein